MRNVWGWLTYTSRQTSLLTKRKFHHAHSCKCRGAPSSQQPPSLPTHSHPFNLSPPLLPTDSPFPDRVLGSSSSRQIRSRTGYGNQCRTVSHLTHTGTCLTFVKTTALAYVQKIDQSLRIWVVCKSSRFCNVMQLGAAEYVLNALTALPQLTTPLLTYASCGAIVYFLFLSHTICLMRGGGNNLLESRENRLIASPIAQFSLKNKRENNRRVQVILCFPFDVLQFLRPV